MHLWDCTYKKNPAVYWLQTHHH